ncbi:protein of unknown function [Burkholderia multivorans]
MPADRGTTATQPMTLPRRRVRGVTKTRLPASPDIDAGNGARHRQRSPDATFIRNVPPRGHAQASGRAW